MISPLPMAIRYVDRIGSDVNTVKSMKNGIDYSKWFARGLEIIFHDFFNISTKLLNIFQRFNLQHKIFRIHSGLTVQTQKNGFIFMCVTVDCHPLVNPLEYHNKICAMK